jgi:Tfp pilus assembly protein PilO
VTDPGHGMPLVRRVFAEYRRILVPLLVLLVVNVVAYAAIVTPLARRVANIEQRDAAAERELAAARKEYDDARGTLTGKDRAAKELETFYANVLPKDLQAARRLTSRRVPQLADNLDVLFDRRQQANVPDRKEGSRLVRLASEVELAGRYNDLRTFIHRLETSPEFVVIDTIELVEGEQETGLLEVTLYLSTYYQAATP